MPAKQPLGPRRRWPTWRRQLHEVIFEADTPAGKLFDVILLALIVISVLAVMLESVPSIARGYNRFFRNLEWVITVLFTLEYILRVVTVRKPMFYVGSFFGVVDLLAILPTYLSLILPGTQSLAVIRGLRLLRLFRIFKLARYVVAFSQLRRALLVARPKIFVFMIAVLTIVIVVGSLMYLIETNAGSGFTSIPASIYWAIVTVTTVGFGDITPVTPLGQMLATLLMITGYAIIAVPTGIVSAELIKADRALNTQVCEGCGAGDHRDGALFCYRCGESLHV